MCTSIHPSIHPSIYLSFKRWGAQRQNSDLMWLVHVCQRKTNVSPKLSHKTQGISSHTDRTLITLNGSQRYVTTNGWRTNAVTEEVQNTFTVHKAPHLHWMYIHWEMSQRSSSAMHFEIPVLFRMEQSAAIGCNHVDCTYRTDVHSWKALHFIMRILKKGNNNTKRLAYMTLVRPILEYGTVC